MNWDIVLKIFAVIGVLGTIGTLVFGFERFIKSRQQDKKVKAKCTFSDFLVPTSFAYQDALVSDHDIYSKVTRDSNITWIEFSKILNDHLNSELFPNYLHQLNSLRSLVKIEISNVGSVEVLDININASMSGYYSIFRNEACIKSDELENNSINIDKVLPLEQIDIYIWTHVQYELIHYIPEIKITHPSGIIKVDHDIFTKGSKAILLGKYVFTRTFFIICILLTIISFCIPYFIQK